MNKGGKYFWRNCGAASEGKYDEVFGIIDSVDNVNWPPWKVSRADV